MDGEQQLTPHGATEIVREHVPSGALLLVASGGRAGVLGLNPRTRESPEPAPPGAATASGVAAIAHLEAQRAAGAEFLLVPGSELWRLDEDRELDRHLRQRHPLVHSSDSGMLFDLRQRELEM